MPWADVVPASRVSIENVEPGARHARPRRSAHRVGRRPRHRRRRSGRRPLHHRRRSGRRSARADDALRRRPAIHRPDSARRATRRRAGVAQNLRYRIEAGDARSLEYTVTVVAAPTITVERIDYDYPDYTGFADRSVERLGDIRAIEGTRVTIHARANQPIEEAAIDFEADGRRDVDAASRRQRRADQLRARRCATIGRRRSSRATCSASPASTAGSNRDPVKYPIDVLPDYGPEVAILAPAGKVRDVRLDETVAIEVEARDPDFALAEVRLHGEAAGRTVFDEQLLSQGTHGPLHRPAACSRRANTSLQAGRRRPLLGHRPRQSRPNEDRERFANAANRFARSQAARPTAA